MKKIVFISTYGDFLATFEHSNIYLLKSMGYEIHCVSNFSEEGYNRKTENLKKLGVVLHHIPFCRTPYDIKNIKIYYLLVELFKKEKFDMVDVHNAVVGILVRMAAKRCNIPRVVYTPHSFFFYKGCPLKNELIFKKVETYFARYTDLLVAINKEDYEAANKMKTRGKALFVPGVGIDVSTIQALKREREKYCKEFQLPLDAVIFVNTGELIRRKNQESILEAFAMTKKSNAYLIICGFGELESKLKQKAKDLGLQDRVVFAGFRMDAKEIMRAADAFVFASFQEGLSVALMEAMACGLPCLASRIRGNIDLIDEGKGGWLFSPNDISTLSKQMIECIDFIQKRKIYGEYNANRIQEYDIGNVQKIMLREYHKLLNLVLS